MSRNPPKPSHCPRTHLLHLPEHGTGGRAPRQRQQHLQGQEGRSLAPAVPHRSPPCPCPPPYLLSREDNTVLAQHCTELVHKVIMEAAAVGTQL